MDGQVVIYQIVVVIFALPYGIGYASYYSEIISPFIHIADIYIYIYIYIYACMHVFRRACSLILFREAAAVRVGNHLGAGRPFQARMAAILSILLTLAESKLATRSCPSFS